MIVDAQLHEPTVRLDWSKADKATRWSLLTELQLGCMRAVGVDRAILFPVDLDWGLYAAEQLPDRFTTVPMIMHGGMHDGLDPTAPDIVERIDEKYAHPGVRALRAMVVVGHKTSLDVPAGATSDESPVAPFDRALAACEERRIPVFISASGNLGVADEAAIRHPDLTLIVDHLGIPQPPSFQRDSPPFRALPELIALAEHPNVMVKVTGTPTLALEPFPFGDLWPSIRRLVDAFGPDRLLWGTDNSRVQGRLGFDTEVGGGLDAPYEGRHFYAESVLAYRETDALTADEKRKMMGETACRVLGWPADN